MTAPAPVACHHLESLRGLQRLAGAILLQAIEDIRYRSGKTREDAIHWVQDPSDAQFSFVFCCRLLHRKPDDVRQFLERRDVIEWLFSAARQQPNAQLTRESQHL